MVENNGVRGVKLALNQNPEVERRHPAGLNFADCKSYALALVSGLPLLYTGNDFSKTDVRAA